VDRDFVSIGRLGSPKGVRGDLKVHSYSGESSHFLMLKEVELRPGEGKAGTARAQASPPSSTLPKALRLKVLRVGGEGPSLTMAFEGYPSPETARVLTGMDIVVPRAAAAPLRPNEWYIDDLVGLALVGAKGERLAVVRSVLEGGAEPWLEVDILTSDASGNTAIVPFRKEFVGEVDVAGGTIELLVPELLSPDGRHDE
jgi:16S rRNA processing protein RimM